MTSHVISGGCGFLGRHVARSLMALGHKVIVVDAVPFPGLRNSAPVAWQTDLSRATAHEFDQIVSDADVIHHYAWSITPSTANEDPVTDLQGNVGATIGLLEALRRRGGGTMVFSSSGGSVYGRLKTVPVPETHALEPISAYGVTKVAAEKYLQLYRVLYGVDTRVARIANFFGSGQNPFRLQGAITTFVHRALAREPITIWGDGEVIRDFIHIADVIAALHILTVRSFSPDDDMPVYNIGSGRGASLNQVLQEIQRLLGRVLDIQRQSSRQFDVPVSVLDIKKARSELDWQPKVILEEGIAALVADLISEPDREFGP